MKIVIVIDAWSEGNGALVATKRLGEELLARGHQVSVVSTNDPGGDFVFYKVPAYYPPLMKTAFIKMELAFGKGKKNVFRKAFEGADLVQIQFPFPMARNAVKVAKEMGVPVIAAFHVQPQNIVSAAGMESSILNRFADAFFNYILFKRVDIIHSPSQFGADLLKKSGINAHVRVISNGIPREFIPVKSERPGWFADRFVILNVGRHAIEKRQELLIEGVRRSKYKENIQLILCGKGPDSQKLKSLVSDLPVQPVIEYATNEDKLLYLNTADLYLHSSVVELESLTCLEAIGCGLPCLIGNSPSSAAPQFALDARFLFKMDNPDDLAEKINYWYENRIILRNMKADVLEMAEKYRFDRCISEMENLYKDTLQYYSEGRKRKVSEIKKIRESSNCDGQIEQLI